MIFPDSGSSIDGHHMGEISTGHWLHVGCQEEEGVLGGGLAGDEDDEVVVVVEVSD